jgi:hypothetical protein
VNKGTPYWLAFLKHPTNLAVVLGMVAASLGLSLPWGGDGLGLGLIALAAIQMIGVATVPGLPAFQAYVNKRNRNVERAERRHSLMQEIQSHGGSPHLRSYEQMCLRVASLYRSAADSSTALTEREVEQIDDLTIDYLRMCLSDSVLRSSAKTELKPAVAYKLRDVQSRLEAGGLSRDDELQLRQAEAEYEEAIARQTRMAARRSALDASLISMPVRLEEVYQMVMTQPRAGNLSQMLEESVSKLRLAEEAAQDIEQSLGAAAISSAALPAQAKTAARNARRSVDQRH